MPVLQALDFWTADMVRAMPEDGMRRETVHGELFVTPAPRLWHHVVGDRLADQLKAYLRDTNIGMVVHGIADISWGPDILVQPDLFVASIQEMRSLEWERVRSLLLAVEILSPASTRADRFAKRRLYQEVGVPDYWVVDADRHLLECWTPDATFPVIATERVAWMPAGASDACVVHLTELFRPL